MSKGIEGFEPQRPRSWTELIGTVVNVGDLDEATRTSKGLIVLETAKGTLVCPTFQFDKDEVGQTRVNPHVGLAWMLITFMQADQQNRSKWTEAGWLAQVRPEYDNRSWADVLKDPIISNRDKVPIYAEILGGSIDLSGWDGNPLIDPSTILPC